MISFFFFLFLYIERARAISRIQPTNLTNMKCELLLQCVCVWLFIVFIVQKIAALQIIAIIILLIVVVL